MIASAVVAVSRSIVRNLETGFEQELSPRLLLAQEGSPRSCSSQRMPLGDLHIGRLLLLCRWT